MSVRVVFESVRQSSSRVRVVFESVARVRPGVRGSSGFAFQFIVSITVLPTTRVVIILG
jgi:hypothetical protein